jgi:hypothetical protein
VFQPREGTKLAFEELVRENEPDENDEEGDEDTSGGVF